MLHGELFPLYILLLVVVKVLLYIGLRLFLSKKCLSPVNSKTSTVVYAIALILAILIAVGFIVLPLSIFFGLIYKGFSI